MSSNLRIAVGSTSQHKIRAVAEAFQRLGVEAEVFGCKTSSGVNEQPVGLQETKSGAQQRAQATSDQFPDCICVGIESGISVAGSVVIDFAFIAVFRGDGRWHFGTSSGIQFPHDCYVLACERGFETTTVGSVIAEKMGGDSTDPHATLTKGKLTRHETLVQGLYTVFAQMFISP